VFELALLFRASVFTPPIFELLIGVLEGGQQITLLRGRVA
jgi:hypothetical protein